MMEESKKDKELSERLEELIKKKSDESAALKKLLNELSKNDVKISNDKNK